MKKRILSLLLCGALMFSLCFQSALAAENEQTETECICTSLCTTETIEEDCPVCSAENADFALCEGEAETAVLSNAEAVYRVAGDAALCGSLWDSGDDNNLMTHNPDTGLYEKTFSSVASGDYQLKVVKNGETWYGTSDDSNFVIRVSAACDVTVTFDADTETVGVRGDSVVQKTWIGIDGVCVVGNGSGVWLNGVSWDPYEELNKMTEISPGIYEITYKNVPAGEDYQFKFTANGWSYTWGGGTEGEAVFNSNQNITFRLQKTSDVTLRLDLTNYDHVTKSGAVYSIISADVPYLDEKGSQQSCSRYTVVGTATTTWNEGWYVAQGDVTISGAVTLEGDVHLILTDGCSLTVNGGISSKVGGALIIYAQSTGDEMGKLTAIGGHTEGIEGLSAGIYVYNGGITINGGAVNATGGTPTPNPNEGTAAVTSGIYAYMSSITVNGGTLTATGGNEIDASIGIYAHNFTVNGGTVTAIGEQSTTNSSIGIWIGETLTINDGTVNATAGNAKLDSYGIFSRRPDSTITINGGTVTAISDKARLESYGIFFLYGDITISGGTVTATGGSSEGNSAGIRANSGIEISGGIVTATGGAVTASGDMAQITSEGIAVINGDITISGDAQVTATGGAATGNELATSHGIYAFGFSETSACNITISGDAQVTATGGAAVLESCGIAALCIVTGVVPEDQGPVGSITITYNAQVTATGGTVTGDERGLTCGFGASGGITVNGGYVTATGGGDTAPYSFGFYANGGITANDGITVNGGHVIAETKATSGTHSALGVAPALPNTTYWWRTADTDELTTSDDSTYFYSDTHTYVEVKVKELICAITFDPNGGVVNPIGANTDIFGRLTNLPTPTRSGSYRFDGWYTAAKGGTKITTDTVFSENTTVYAQWTYSGGDDGTTRYTVSFDTNGGSKVSNKTVTRNSAVSEPTAPTKDGYTFDGWYSDKELKTAYDFDTKVTKSFTLYAKWTEKATEPDKPTKPDKPTQPVEPTESTEPTAPEWKNPFTDVSENDWFFESVKYANENGLMGGTTNTTFEPNEPLTRGMLVAILYRADGEPAVNKSIPFSDVKADMYYANATIWAQQNGIVNGVTENEFAPDENITREQIAAIMFRYAKYKGYDVSVGESTNILSYTDAESISEYAVEAIQYVVGAGLMKGKTATTINSLDNATRAEVAAILQRFIEGNK